MGLFSFFSRKKKLTKSSEAQLGEVQRIEKQWHHTLERLTIVTHPLGNTRGTDLDRAVIMSSLVSMSQAISVLIQEAQSQHSLFHALSLALTAKAAAEDLPLATVEISSLANLESAGYSARAEVSGQRFTALFGDRAPVGRASTPFHEDIDAHFTLGGEVATSEHTVKSYVLALDGISYAAVTVASTLS
jgi:hypothetical protein